MYSVKPGRGPSILGGVAGGFVAVFGVIWTILAISMGAPLPFALFGMVFVVMALAGAAYNFYNATAPERMSAFDITSGNEEGDPITQALGRTDQPRSADSDQPTAGPRKYPGDYCPFCGAKVGANFQYCPKCGKDI